MRVLEAISFMQSNEALPYQVHDAFLQEVAVDLARSNPRYDAWALGACMALSK